MVTTIDKTAPTAVGRMWALATAIVAIAAGLVASRSNVAPTGRPCIDAVLLGAGVGFITIVGARAPWWAVSAAAGGALAIGVDPVLMVLATVALMMVWAVGSRRVERPEVLAAATGVVFNVLARAEVDGFLGLSALVGVLAAVLVFVSGISHYSRPIQRLAWTGVGCGALLAVAAGSGLGYAVVQARDHLVAGVRTAEKGVAALENGDFESARDWFRQSSEHLTNANEQLTRPWTGPALLVPIVAQHRDAVVEMSGVGAMGAATVADALDQIDFEGSRIRDGEIDLEFLAALYEPLRRVRVALEDLRVATDESRSPWLIPRATYQLDDFDTSIAGHAPSLDNALSGIRLAPEMLGASRRRRYLVLFTTPAESRGLGGFIGSYAELTVDGGRLVLGEVGQAADLDAALLGVSARIDGPAEFLDQYGRFGFDLDGDGAVGDGAFRNLAMTPHFPWVGEIAADLYAQTTGYQVDGVISADPLVLAELLRVTGPIQVPAFDQELTADNAFGYLLHGQYVLGDNERRGDALGFAAAATFEALIDGALPDPINLARRFGYLVGERRLLMWSADAAEQALLEQVGLAGAIPALDGADGWAVTVSNGTGNKIDTYLRRRARYQSATDEAGVTSASLRIELTNSAPADGLPRSIIGNRLGLPSGTSRLYVSVYSALGLDGALFDSEPLGVTVGFEQGWNVYSRFIDIPPGGTVTIEMTLRGVVDYPAEVVTWEQPMASRTEAID